jgi:tetratricopeptide (TPR) repeat protein
VWQGLYEELKDKNFIIISVAFDTGGVSAVKDWIRPATPAQLPKELLDIMGWEESLSSKGAIPTYPCLLDEKHIVAERYNIVNVPMAVWINESGRIVRPAEAAGATDGFRKMDRATYRMPVEVAAAGKQARKRYIDAIRDWVEKGDASIYALSPDEVHRRIHSRTEHEALAAANFRLGQYLYQQGHPQAAQRYFAEAKRLHPENWSFKRQSWELEGQGKASGPEFWAAVDALGENLYYPTVDL